MIVLAAREMSRRVAAIMPPMAFDPEGGGRAPTELTDFDRGFLAGPYAGQGHVGSGAKQGSIVARIVRARRAGD